MPLVIAGTLDPHDCTAAGPRGDAPGPFVAAAYETGIVEVGQPTQDRACLLLSCPSAGCAWRRPVTFPAGSANRAIFALSVIAETSTLRHVNRCGLRVSAGNHLVAKG